MLKTSRCPSAEPFVGTRSPNLYKHLQRLAKQTRGKALGVRWEDCEKWSDLGEAEKDRHRKLISTYRKFT